MFIFETENMIKLSSPNRSCWNADHAEGDMGVYGIAVSGFFFLWYFGNFNFHVRYCGII